jgi:selenocysteine lyase/cysteine desulfurase
LRSLLEPWAQGAFPDIRTGIYLDTPTSGIPTADGADALQEAVTRWRSGEVDWAGWEAEADRCREVIAHLINCAPTDVALLPSVVPAVASVALQARPGPFVVFEHEYRSNLLPWLSCAREGRPVRTVPLSAGSQGLVDAMDSETSVVTVSAVQSLDGCRVDLPAIVERARACDAWVFVDATQSLGAIALDVTELQVDFVAAAGYKWLLGARGTGYFYVRPELQTQLDPLLAAPHSAADVMEGRYYGGPYVPFDDARRFDQSPAWLSWVTARPSLDLLVDLDQRDVEEHVLGLAAAFRDGCIKLGLRDALSESELPTQIVALRPDDPEKLTASLEAADIKASLKPSGVRFGFHLYNDLADVEAVLEAVWHSVRSSDVRVTT